MEEYNFTVEYLKGQSNSVADALSRINISSEDLKTMNDQISCVMTRAQYQKLKNSEKVSTSDLADNIATSSKSDQPRVVEIIKKPNLYTELSLIDCRKLRKMESDGLVTEIYKNFSYVPSRSTIYLCTMSKPRSPITRDGLVRDLAVMCKKLTINELCILRDEMNKEFINGIVDIINKLDKWTGPRICILNKVQRINNIDNRKVILNDFHLLTSSGHAGTRRMSNNIKRYYFWPSMDKDIYDYVTKCEQCQKQNYSVSTKQPMVITSTALLLRKCTWTS